MVLLFECNANPAIGLLPIMLTLGRAGITPLG
jgi:hypothetical protein